jgi:hypothetical protein
MGCSGKKSSQASYFNSTRISLISVLYSTGQQGTRLDKAAETIVDSSGQALALGGEYFGLQGQGGEDALFLSWQVRNTS